MSDREEWEEVIGRANGKINNAIQPQKQGEDAVNSVVTFNSALAEYKEKTLPCCKCMRENSIGMAGYFCVDCMSEMGIGMEKNNYKHGYV